MEIIKTVAELKDKLKNYRVLVKSIGFVPTMGALHAGHAELVKRSVEENNVTIVSIFVNPTQFNNSDDLDHYPRTPADDYSLLESLRVDLVFAPNVDEIYPEPDNRVFDFGTLDKVMEGEFRSGHFNGVAQVVSKLFDVVQPDKAYFGEKDFQQLAVIKQMVKQLHIPVEIVGVPTVREKSGLAMSSRNQRLTEVEKINASEIYNVLKGSLLVMDQSSPGQVSNQVIEQINRISGLHVEYFSIVDGDSLETVSSWEDSKSIIGCIAVFCGDVRLIDNIRFK